MFEGCAVPMAEEEADQSGVAVVHPSLRRAKLTRAALTTERSLAIASSSLTNPWSRTSIVRSVGREEDATLTEIESNGRSRRCRRFQ